MSSFIQPTKSASRVERVGIQCPDCGGKTRVTSTRNESGEKIRRNRACRDCGRKFTTLELIISSKVPTST